MLISFGIIVVLAIIGAFLSDGEDQKSNNPSTVITKAASKVSPDASKEPTQAPTPTEVIENLSKVETVYTLSAGNYTSGVDIPIGKCNVSAVKGNGNISSDNMFNGGINEMFGKDDGTGLYTSDFKGLDLKDGTILSLSGNLTVKLDFTKITGDYTSREYDKSKSLTLSNGNYEVGSDLPAGNYNLVVISGNGNCSSSNLFHGGINEVFGKDDGTNFYTESFDNLQVTEGDTITISGGVKIKFIPEKKK